jgi:predicted KAP-like P-loop ATPase
MSTAEIKLIIFELLATTKDTKVLNSIYKQLKSQTEKKESDFWDEFSPEQKEEIMISIEESDKGETTSHSQVMKKYKKWL